MNDKACYEYPWRAFFIKYANTCLMNVKAYRIGYFWYIKIQLDSEA